MTLRTISANCASSSSAVSAWVETASSTSLPQPQYSTLSKLIKRLIAMPRPCRSNARSGWISQQPQENADTLVTMLRQFEALRDFAFPFRVFQKLGFVCVAEAEIAVLD